SESATSARGRFSSRRRKRHGHGGPHAEDAGNLERAAVIGGDARRNRQAEAAAALGDTAAAHELARDERNLVRWNAEPGISDVDPDRLRAALRRVQRQR